MVCTLHYFGILGLIAIVLAEILTSHATLRSRIWRLLTVSAGPIALGACLPFVRGQMEGFSHLSYLGALTIDYAAGTVVELLGVPMLIGGGLIIAWWISELERSRHGDSERLREQDRIVRLQPTAGLSALLLVPIMVILVSLVYQNLMLDRDMIAALLGSTALIAMLGCHLSSRVLAVAVIALVLISGLNLRVIATDLSALQTGEEFMLKQCVAMANDGLPIVTLSPQEAYLLYEYAPKIRPQLYVADLRPAYDQHLSSVALSLYELSAKAQTVQPDLPELANLDQLQLMGHFHLVHTAEGNPLASGSLPFQVVSGFGWDGIYRVNL